MDRSNSVTSSTSSSSRASSSAEPFAYQTRLMERQLSLSRSNSVSKATGGSFSSSSSTGTGTGTASRRWAPSHRVGGSVDAVRGKFEEWSRSDAGINGQMASPSPTRSSFVHDRSTTPTSSSAMGSYRDPPEEEKKAERTSSMLKRHTMPAPIIASPLSPNTTGISVVSPDNSSSSIQHSTSRIRLPTNSVSSHRRFYDTVESEAADDSFDLRPSSRLRRSVDFDSIMKESRSETDEPSWKKPELKPVRRQTAQAELPFAKSPPDRDSAQYTAPRPPAKLARNNSISLGLSERLEKFESNRSSSPIRLERKHSVPPRSASPTKLDWQYSVSQRSSVSDKPSLLGSITNSVHQRAPSPEKLVRAYSLDSTSDVFPSSASKPPIPAYRPPPAAPSAFANQNVDSVMYPSPYRSSYMAKKKGTYGDELSVGRRLGRHLPRIASGDGNEEPEPQRKPPPSPVLERPERKEKPPTDLTQLTRQERREKRMRQWQLELEEKPPAPPPKGRAYLDDSEPRASLDDVAGMPGRLRLGRDIATPTSPIGPSIPVPSSRIRTGLWADTQRHLIRAYEYLCHVGEAQQWIEGCLGEELDFGVVEMEEGLRNGVVLARLARAFMGEDVVRRIFEAPKLDFRQTDNINHFFNLLRHVGLPDCFIFETTDLYNKKNIPKVIFCIHALSHLLARRGMAERIGNLLGQLQFSDDQLQKTEKGLNDAGVAMPNFGNVGRELAKEMNEEPEVEVETEEERRDRLLLENEGSIIVMQSIARGFLQRKANATQYARMRLAGRYVTKLQARCRGVMTRVQHCEKKRQQSLVLPAIVGLQAFIRGFLTRCRQKHLRTRLRALQSSVTKFQAQSRGVLQRRRFAKLKGALTKGKFSITKLQAVARAKLVKNSHQQLQKALIQPKAMAGVRSLQAVARGYLARLAYQSHMEDVKSKEDIVVALQAQLRGVLARRQVRAKLAKLDDVSEIIVRIQAAARCYLARRRLLNLIRALRRARSSIVAVQALSRANLQRKKQKALIKALGEVKTIKTVGGLQAFARAALARKRHQEQDKELQFVEPEVVGLQAVARGALCRIRYFSWRDYLHNSQDQATYLQALLRGTLERWRYTERLKYYRENLNKIVKIQSLFRAKDTREQYRQLTLGHNVNVGTIKNFVHLLDDSEADFEDEIEVERLRKRVVQGIRANQALETEVTELNVKIALIIQNVKSFEELVKTRRRHGTDTAAHASRASALTAHGDPFAGPNTLDHATKRKLELYQQLFYLLQSEGSYLSKLFERLEKDTQNTNRGESTKLVERVVLTLFGYGQDQREDYLFLKFLQMAITREVQTIPSVSSVMQGEPMYLAVALQYGHSKQALYIRDTLQAIVTDVVNQDDLDLDTDPCSIYKARINAEEMRTGVTSRLPKEVDFDTAINDPDNRTVFIHHTQFLLAYVKMFVNTIIASTKKIPYSIRFIARETLHALKAKFPREGDDAYATSIGHVLYNRYIHPAILSPDKFDLVANNLDVSAGKNLLEISRVLLQIVSGREFGEDNAALTPINPYIRQAIKEMRAWFLEVADVPDAETQYHAHEFLDAAFQPKPIYISPNEVYSMHSLLARNIDRLAPSRDDPMRHILVELGGAPTLVTDELNSTWDNVITLELTNRFANVKDPHAEEKALWVQAKRAVLAILRVQPARDLVECLMQPVSEEHELFWEDIVDRELMNDHMRQRQRRMPSTTGAESAYRLDDIRSLTFKEVKAHSIYFLLELEKQGKVTREDGYQGILNAIAGDVRSKHRKRLQRQQELESMSKTLKHLSERKKYFEEQIKSYHNYVEAAMNTMQKSNKKKTRMVVPFTRQFYHLRSLIKSGKSPQFGSFRYSAQDLYDKGVLLSLDKYSPRQFNRIDIVLSSDIAGVFNIELYSSLVGSSSLLADTAVRMEDLLQAQFENRTALSLFDGMAKFNLNLLLFQINKKFYV